MKKTLIISLLAGLLLSSGCTRNSAANGSSSEQSASSIADDQQNLQGKWRLQHAMYNGQPLMNDVLWVFDGDTMTIVLGGNYDGGVHTHFQLGTGDRPNTILIKAFDNPLANQGYVGGTYTGVYKLSGDKLRVCYDLTGREYPKSFDAGKGSMRMSYEFIRAKS